VACKKLFAESLNNSLAPFRERRRVLARDPDQVWDILHQGGKQAQAIAQHTLAEVKDAIGLP
ncbi:MAG: tryptophan--tRNA ligase, partial [Chloroflexi bacterium]|nr:tryptophan--tRNA ligase [Chloroflexota bacterium]